MHAFHLSSALLAISRAFRTFFASHSGQSPLDNSSLTMASSHPLIRSIGG
jgi:hypothetical protein